MSSPSAPAVRANIARDTVELARALLAERWMDVGDVTFQLAASEVMATNRLAWLAIEKFEFITETLHRTLGDVAYRALIKEQLVEVTKGDIFSGMVVTYRTLFGNTSTALLRAYASAFGVLYRDFGRAEVVVTEAQPKEARLRLTGLPPAHHRPTFLLGVAGSLEGILFASQCMGSVSVEWNDPEHGEVVYLLRLV